MTAVLPIAAACVMTFFSSQTVQPPAYRSVPLKVTNGDVTLAGTLTIPEGAGPFPALVLVTGSGAQNRDEDVFGFKVFAVLADHLTRNGFAVFRYDDRGVGESTGRIATSTTSDFADDALAGVAGLAAMPEIDAKRIGILGHSEGAVAAAIAAAKSPAVAFIVLMAGPGVPGALVMRQQALDAARTLGATDDQVERIDRAYRAVTEAVRSGADRETVTAAVKDLIRAQVEGRPAAQVAALGDVSAFVEKSLGPAVAQLTSPWVRFFMSHDPAEALRKVAVPVYAVFGGLDTQVLPSQNERPVREALASNRAAVIKVYPGANHLFQPAKTGLVTEYAALEKAFLPGFLDDLVSWLRNARRPAFAQ
jgi:pimeloyl-ACP methyl ester carboxylesterase